MLVQPDGKLLVGSGSTGPKPLVGRAHGELIVGRYAPPPAPDDSGRFAAAEPVAPDDTENCEAAPTGT